MHIYNKRNKTNILLEYLLVLLLFFSTGPYFTWGTNFFFFISPLLILIPLTLSKKYSINNIVYALLFGFLFFFSYIENSSLITSLFYFSIPFYLLANIDIRAKALEIFVLKFFPLILLISLASYIFVGLNIIDLPTFSVDQPNNLKLYDFTSHIFFLQPNLSYGVINRFQSLYDEPGTIGTLCAMILFFYNKKMSNKVMYTYILTGLFTLSFFFIVMIFLFFIISPIKSFSNKLNVKFVFFVIGLLFFLFLILPDDLIQQRIFNRFIIEDGKLAGDNRNSANFDFYFWNTFIYSSELYFGTTGGSDYSEGSFSLHKMIYLKGLVLVSISLFSYLSYFFKYKQSFLHFAIYSLAFLAMIYQRPYLWNVFYFIFFTTIFESDFYMDKRREFKFIVKQ